jgi:hypothetical protein
MEPVGGGLSGGCDQGFQAVVDDADLGGRRTDALANQVRDASGNFDMGLQLGELHGGQQKRVNRRQSDNVQISISWQGPSLSDN